MSAALAELHAMIADMDLPPSRKTSSDPGDLRWLARNMGIRNSDHPSYRRASAALRTVLRAA